MTRKRSRSQSTGGKASSLLRNLAATVIVIAMASLVVQSAAFDTIQGNRNTDIGTGSDGNALVGIDLPENVPIGDGGAASCNVGPDARVVTKDDVENIDTSQDVVVVDIVAIDITTSGNVRIESGAHVDGNIDAGGCVILESGARAEGDVDAGGEVTLKSGSRVGGDVSAGGDVTLESGSRTRVGGDVAANGDVTLRSGSRVGGSVSAGGAVTVEEGAQVVGEVSGGGGSSSYPRLVTITNNQAGSLAVTISLIDPDDGSLVIDGNHVGNTATISIIEGGSRTVNIDPTSGAGSDIAFRIEAINTADNTAVTLERSVPTVIIETERGNQGNPGGGNSGQGAVGDDTGGSPP